MPRTNIAVTTITEAAVAEPAAIAGDATNDHSFTNDGRTFLRVKNTGAGAQTITIITSQVVGPLGDLAVADRAISVPASAIRYIGPFSSSLYGQPSDSGKVWVDVAETTWELQALSLP